MTVFPCVLLAGAWIGHGCDGKQEQKAIDVKVVKYDGLKEAVRKRRGNVVVVYFWVHWNPPSISNLPKLLEMQRKHGMKGLETITVEISDTSRDETPELQHERVLDLLKKLNANVTNLILDEKADLIADRLGTHAPFLCAFVFNRQGKWFRFSAEETSVDPVTIENLVVRLL